jgi:hypothetical protein
LKRQWCFSLTVVVLRFSSTRLLLPLDAATFVSHGSGGAFCGSNNN